MLPSVIGQLLRFGHLVAILFTLLCVPVRAGIDNFRHALPNPLEANCTNCRKPILSAEKVLIRHLLEGYSHVGKNGRPVLNISTVMNVTFGLGLIQMDLDEKYKVLKMSMWSRYMWQDEYLVWEPAEYGGVKKVRLASNLIWLPDIMLYNSADPKSELRDVLAVVRYDGKVHWVPHQIFKSSCSVDVTNFPFDYQNCHMWFGSWTHSSSELDVNMAFKSGIDLSTFQSDYLDSSDWNIEDTTAMKDIMPSVNDTPNFGVLKFQLHMKRKLVFSSYILTLPCVFLACLTLVVFWLPPDRPDRTALAMRIFASFLVLLLILVEAVPATASSVPVLGVYYCFNLVIIMMSVFLSSLVVNVSRAGEGTRPVPNWLKLVTTHSLGRLLLVSSSSNPISSATRRGSGGGRTYSKKRQRHKDYGMTHETTATSTPSMIIQNNYGLVHMRRASDPTSGDIFDDFLDERGGATYTNNGIHLTGATRTSHITARPGGRPVRLRYDTTSYQTSALTEPLISSLNSTSGGESSIFEESSRTVLEAEVREMRQSVAQIRRSLLEKHRMDAYTAELARTWHEVALVLDRFFFIMYIILIVVSLVTLFPRPK